ncbi:MAG: MFS transporter [Thermoleophilaceae bacterium]
MGDKRLTLVATILASAVVFIDTTVVNVALPALREDFDAGLAAQQWVVEAYLLTLASLLLVGGSLGDLLGRRRVFIAGLVGFGATSALCAVAPSVELLVAARALQGIAGALLVPSSLAIVTATFDEDERGAAIGTWTAWTGIGIVIGPLVGGLLVDAVSWRLVFALNLPLVAATLALALRVVRESADPEAGRRVDWQGGLLCALAFGGVVFGLVEQPTEGFGSPLVWVPMAAGSLAAAAFLARARSARSPMLPLGLFRSRNFSAANLATFAIYAALGAITFFSVLFVQQVGGYSAFGAGAAFMPISLLLFLLSRRFGALADRIGSRVLMTAGPLVSGIGALLFLRVGEEAAYVADVLPAVVVFGLGLAMTVAPLTATVLGAVEQRHAGVASGVNNAVARVAGLMAIAAVGAIVSAGFGSKLDERLPADGLGAEARAVAERAQERPLAPVEDDRVPAAERDTLRPALDDASVAGFHAGILAVAALLFAGAALSAAGVRNAVRTTSVH